MSEMKPFPDDFPEKGRFRTWAKDWTPLGFADEPQHTGQQPVRFPLDATPFECFLGGYIARPNNGAEQ